MDNIMTKPKLIKLPKPADTTLMFALLELDEAIKDPTISEYICLAVFKDKDGNEQTRYYSSGIDPCKDLYLNKLIEKHIMGDL